MSGVALVTFIHRDPVIPLTQQRRMTTPSNWRYRGSIRCASLLAEAVLRMDVPEAKKVLNTLLRSAFSGGYRLAERVSGAAPISRRAAGADADRPAV
ncbi:hypothetical protein M8494_34780 [Serratia ureilytica]